MDLRLPRGKMNGAHVEAGTPGLIRGSHAFRVEVQRPMAGIARSSRRRLRKVDPRRAVGRVIDLCRGQSEAYAVLRSKAAYSDVEGCAGEQSFSAAADTGQIAVFARTEVHAFLHQIAMKVGGEAFILIAGLSREQRRRNADSG